MTIYTIKPTDMWQTTSLDCAVAEELFGWKWLAFNGRPTTSHPEYRTRKDIRVRRFFPPVESLGKQWQEYFKEVPHEPANGDEPLCYSYCSSNGPHMVPHFSGHESAVKDMEQEIHRRGLWAEYREHLKAQIGKEDDASLNFADCESKCIAALAAVGSKYVTSEPPTDNT